MVFAQVVLLALDVYACIARDASHFRHIVVFLVHNFRINHSLLEKWVFFFFFFLIQGVEFQTALISFHVVLQARRLNHSPILRSLGCWKGLSRTVYSLRGWRWFGVCICHGSGFTSFKFLKHIPNAVNKSRSMGFLWLSCGISYVSGSEFDFSYFDWTVRAAATPKAIVGECWWQRPVCFSLFILVPFISGSTKSLLTGSGGYIVMDVHASCVNCLLLPITFLFPDSW